MTWEKKEELNDYAENKSQQIGCINAAFNSYERKNTVIYTLLFFMYSFLIIYLAFFPVSSHSFG